MTGLWGPRSGTDTGQARCLAVFGTASDVGKSVVATALCRLLGENARVAPFKAQNMSNNSCVTREGGEMGRSQYVQALAAGAIPHVDMNPILLKPSGDQTSQLVLLGRPHSTRQAARFFEDRDELFAVARGALQRLRRACDVVVLEGAGSCAEVNLRPREIVNFPMAHACDASVILVADIDRGGVFAQVVGTLEVMPDADRARVAGVIINRFRGHRALFDDGVSYLERRTGVPVLGVVPFASELRVDAEDSLSLGARLDPPPTADEDVALRIAVVHLPHVSNATDFDAFESEPNAAVHFCHRPRDLSSYSLVVLPGSKAVRQDLEWLERSGWAAALSHHRAQGGRVLGICGGYQMLGRVLRDPEGLEGPAGESRGLGMLEVETLLQREKQLGWTRGYLSALGVDVEGYEIHQGVTESSCGALLAGATEVVADAGGVLSDGGSDATETASSLQSACSGAVSDDGRVWGTYLHGLFDAPGVVAALARHSCPGAAAAFGPLASVPAHARSRSHFDRLARHFREHLDLPRLQALAFRDR